MSQNRRYLLSAVTNWLAFAATLLTAFFLSPYLIAKLGDSRYGVWIFVEAILAYFMLFDLGIAACVVRFVARFNTSREQHELNRLVSSCFVLFCLLGALAFLLGLAIAPWIAPMLGKAGMEDGEIRAFALLMLGNLALTLPLSLFPAIIDGMERFAAKSVVHITILGIRVTAMIALMEQQPSLLGLGIILTICNIVENLALALLAFYHLPGLRLSWRLVDRSTLRLVKGYSLDAFLAMVAGRVSVQSGAIVIGICLGAPEITWFAIAARLVEFAKALLRSATTTLTPAISSLETSGNLEGIRHLLLKGTRWALYIILPIHLGLVLFGGPFLRVWMGSAEYEKHCYPALVVLSATLSLSVAQSISARILYGTGKLNFYARLSLMEAALNLGISLVLVRHLGIIGVAWAAAIPNLLFCTVVIGHVCRALDVPTRDYLVGAWLRPLLVAVVPLAIWINDWKVSGWYSLAVALLAGLVPYVLMALALEGIRPRILFNAKRAVLGSTRRAA